MVGLDFLVMLTAQTRHTSDIIKTNGGAVFTREPFKQLGFYGHSATHKTFSCKAQIIIQVTDPSESIFFAKYLKVIWNKKICKISIDELDYYLMASNFTIDIFQKVNYCLNAMLDQKVYHGIYNEYL